MAEVPVEQGCAATPAAQLRDRIMNPCVAKSEAEWWAARRIEKLEEDAAQRIAGQAELAREQAELASMAEELVSLLLERRRGGMVWAPLMPDEPIGTALDTLSTALSRLSGEVGCDG